MEQMHSLLKRQLRRNFDDQFNIPKEWQNFIDAVNDAYHESDMDREMLERSLELSSQELLQANYEVRAIFLAIPDLLFRLDGDGRILNYKAGATTDLLLDPKDLIGKRIQDVPLKQVSEKFTEAIQQVHQSKNIINIEYSLSIQDQSIFFEARLVPIPDDQIVVIIRNITERKQMEEAFREAADKFRFVFENAYDGISVFEETPVRKHRKLIDCNKRYAEMAGRSREELLQIGTTKDVAKTLSEDNHESNLHEIVFGGSFSWIRPDGKDNVIEYTAVPIKVQGKTITIGIDRDITERKRAEEELRESEERYRRLIEVSPEAIAVHANGRIVYVNPASVKLLRARDESELIGKPVLDVVHPDYKELVRQRVIAAMEQGRAQPMEEEKFLCLDGTVIDVDVVSVPTTFKGKPAIQVIVRNITERRQVEEALELAATRFKLVTLATRDAIFDWDINTHQIWRNENYQQLFGAMERSADDTDWWVNRIHPDDRESVFNTHNAALQSDANIVSVEYRLRRTDGSYAIVFDRSHIVRDAKGRAIRMIGAITDITERKQAEVELKNERNLLRTLIDNMPEQINYKDAEGRYLLNNRAHLQSIHVEHQEDALGRTVFDFHPEELAKQYFEDEMQIIQTGQAMIDKEEVVVRRDTGDRRWHLTSKIPIKDDRGKVTSFIGISHDITEQKRAMETLTLLSHTVKSIGESISITDLRNNLLFVNEAFLKTYGYTERELIGKSINIVSCDPHVHEQTILAETINGGWQGELMNRKKDGTMFPIHLSTSTVCDENGQPIGLVGVATDITERMRAEEELQNERNLLRTVIDNLPDLFHFKDAKGRYLVNNRAHLRSIGMKNQEDTLGKTTFDFHPLDLAKQYNADDMKIINTGEPLIDREELVFRHEMNELRWHLTSKIPLKDNQGKVTGIIGITRDITERKMAEEELQRERNLLRTVIDNLPDGIYTKDLNCRKTLANRTDVYNIGRKSEADVLGKDDYELFPREMAEKFVADDRSVIQTGQPVIDREEYVIDEKGQKHFLLTTKLPFRNEQGQIIGLIGIGHDITERKHAEEALQESNEKLRNIVENSTNLFYSRNTDQVFTYLSPQTRNIFDCEPDEAMVNFKEFMTDNPINKLGCELAEKAVKIGARQETYELELLSRKGRSVWVEIQEAPVVQDGKTIAIVGAATDITERRWAEMALLVSEKKYRDIVTWAPVGIFQSTQSGKLLSGNSSIAEMLGYENLNDLVGCNIRQDIYYDEKDWERFIAENISYEKKVALSHETRWKKKDGSLIWVLITVHDVRDKSSEILYYEGFVFDITEHKHAEEALRESEERYRLLVENSTDIVTEINAEDKYLYVSPNVKSILDFDPIDLVGTNVLSRVYGKDKAIIGEILSKLGGSATYRYRDRLGGLHWFESSGRVYYTSSGEQRMVMVSRDITQRRKAEQELEISRKQLQHFTEHLEHVLEEEKKRISRELHDELGQLLTILKFDLSWLRLEGMKGDSNTVAKIEAMMESVNEALASVKRIAKEIRPPQLDALGLVGAMQWDLDQVEKKTGLKGIVTVELADGEIKGQINTVLYSVFREALTNVLRHAQAGQIFVKLSQRSGSIILTIRDDGRGITKKELKGTTSLGLVGIRERIRMVGGSLSIEGKKGQGTMLSVEIPLKNKK